MPALMEKRLEDAKAKAGEIFFGVNIENLFDRKRASADGKVTVTYAMREGIFSVIHELEVIYADEISSEEMLAFCPQDELGDFFGNEPSIESLKAFIGVLTGVHKKILELEGVGLSFDDRTLAMDSLLVEVGTDFKESYSQFKRLLSGKVMSGISIHNPAIASTQMTLDIARSHSTYTVADPIRDFKIDELNFDFGNNLDPSLFVKTLLTVAEEKRGRMEQAVGPAEGHREDPQRAIPGGGLGMGRDTVAIDGTELVDLNLALWNSVLEHAPHEDEGTSVLMGCLERACKHLEIRYNLSDIEETKRLLLD